MMFVLFVGATLYITYWASKRTRSLQDYYTPRRTHHRPAKWAGDFMSTAFFFGISALVYTPGYDGLIYSIGFLIGWLIILFLIAERLCNLGRYTFADVVSYRLKQKFIRTLSACGFLVVVALYLIAQMVDVPDFLITLIEQFWLQKSTSLATYASDGERDHPTLALLYTSLAPKVGRLFSSG